MSPFHFLNTKIMNAPIVIERVYNSPIAVVWKAITNNEDMRRWYFELEQFKPEVGFEFTFLGGKDEKQPYLHLCQVTEVIDGKKIAYTWRYDKFEGSSLVTFELFSEGPAKTKLKLTHSGLDTFPKNNPDFAKENFVQGWTDIIGTSLRNYVEKNG
jgi:uncharacterized protein YndB with AHSA1/START domain